MIAAGAGTRVPRKPLTATQRDLALRYLPLARSLARPFKRNWPGSRDDFESAACLALVEAAGAFDPGRNVKFATFARHRIWGSLRDVQRGLVALGWRCDPAHAPSVGRLPREPDAYGRMPGREGEGRVGREIEEIDGFEHRIRSLPQGHKRLMRLLYVRDMTGTAAGGAMGVSQSRISLMHREAIAYLDGSWAAKLRNQAC